MGYEHSLYEKRHGKEKIEVLFPVSGLSLDPT